MHTDYPHIASAGESALVLYLGAGIDPQTNAWVQLATEAIEQTLGADLVDLVPAYASILVIFRRDQSLPVIARRIRAALPPPPEAASAAGKEVALPVYYAPESGADLEALARRAGLSVQDVIECHAGTVYQVYAIGFAPGFAYLGQVDERIAAPRLATPRQRVPRGSVAIAERQTAVYPAPSPGGWNLIGRCPVPLFNPAASPHMPVAVGDRVRFEPVSRARFLELGGELE
ncbi:MAG: 5-oxoprolinase subunit PxpB [Halioglobus sp.]|nr:5-oxoprolinase subunit PxpB [Halioglobus sp.]